MNEEMLTWQFLHAPERLPQAWANRAGQLMQEVGIDALALPDKLNAQMRLTQALNQPGTKAAIHLRDGNFAHAVRAISVAADGVPGSRWNVPHYWILDSGLGSHGGAYRMTEMEIWTHAEAAVLFR